MGFHVSWIAVQGRTPEAARAELGLAATAEREFLPESDITGVELPSGWYLVFFNDPLPGELQDTTLRALSQDAEVVACVVEEASMVSLARGYAGGRRTWEVVHDAGQGLEHLAIEGDPPPALAGIHARLLEEARSGAGADYVFDVPAELGKALTGFRHDEDVEGADEDVFVVLERTGVSAG